MSIVSASKTDVGRVRDGNEDSYLEQPPLFVVADGMGGHLAGDVASSIAIDSIRERAKGQWPPPPGAMASMIEEANAAIYAKAQSDQSLRGMGTTCTAVLIRDGKAHVAHVGDSRAYLFRDGELEQITEDHTLVGRMVREGRLRAEEAERHPQRSIITRALGVDEQVKVDTTVLGVAEGDRILICSDGLTAMVDGGAIADLLVSHDDLQSAADALVDMANEAGGEDNITVVLVELQPGNAAPPVPAEQRVDTSPEGGGQAAPEPLGAGEARAQPVRPSTEDVVAQPTWRRRLFAWVLGIALIAAVAFGAARWALSNSWFVGVNDEGLVTIYQGIPDEIAGLDLKDVEVETTVELAELPPSLRQNVQAGIKVGSRDEAVETVMDLEERVHDFSDGDQTSGRSRDRF